MYSYRLNVRLLNIFLSFNTKCECIIITMMLMNPSNVSMAPQKILSFSFSEFMHSRLWAILMTWNGNHRFLFKLLSRCDAADTFSMKFNSYKILRSRCFCKWIFFWNKFFSYWFLAMQVVIKYRTPYSLNKRDSFLFRYCYCCVFLLVHFTCLSVWLLIFSVTIEKFEHNKMCAEVNVSWVEYTLNEWHWIQMD